MAVRSRTLKEPSCGLSASPWQCAWCLVSRPSFAQEWSAYTNQVDRFEVNLPGQPRVEEVKVGSAIGVRCHQLRDGSSGCLLGFITLEGAAERIVD